MMLQGACHCGVNRFQIDLPGITRATVCRCKACHKNGFMWAELPESLVRVTSGHGDDLVTFPSETVSYKFCKACGTGLFGTHTYEDEPNELLCINVRAILGLNPFEIVTTEDPRFVVDKTKVLTKNAPPDPEALQNESLYNGSCVCGAVSISLQSHAITHAEIKEDNCSICTRNAFIGIYPHRSKVSIKGLDDVTEYLFDIRFSGHPFCKVCGVQVFQILHGPPPEVVAAASKARQTMIKAKLEIQPVNVRVLDGVNLGDLHIHQVDEGTAGYALEDERSL